MSGRIYRAVDMLVAVLPVLTGLAPMILVYRGSRQHLGWEIWQAGVLALVVELLGILCILMYHKIKQHNQNHTAARDQITTWWSWGAYGAYLAVVLLIAVGFEIQSGSEGLQVAIIGFLSLLSLPGHLLFAVNFRMSSIEVQKEQDKAERKAARANRAAVRKQAEQVLQVQPAGEQQHELGCDLPGCKWSSRARASLREAQKAKAGHMSWHGRNGHNLEVINVHD